MSSTTRKRFARVQEERDSVETHEPRDDKWGEHLLCDTSNIPAREGYTQRWMRTHIRGEIDYQNIRDKINQGWRPRMADTIQKTFGLPIIDFEGQSVIGVRGSILVERPIELHARHKKKIQEMTDLQLRSVYGLMNETPVNRHGDPRPTMDITRRVSYREPIVDD